MVRDVSELVSEALRAEKDMGAEKTKCGVAVDEALVGREEESML